MNTVYFTICTVFVILASLVYGETIDCTAARSCREKRDDNAYECTQDNDCIINCGKESCFYSEFNCRDGQNCNINCVGDGGGNCYSAIFNCPQGADCNIQCQNALNFKQACKKANIYAQTSNNLNMYIDSVEGAMDANIYCPDQGNCNINNIGHLGLYKSKIFSNTAESTATLKIEASGDNSGGSLYEATVKCPISSAATINCEIIIDTVGNAYNPDNMLILTNIYAKNAFQNLKVECKGTECGPTECNPKLFCSDGYSNSCDLKAIDTGNNEFIFSECTDLNNYCYVNYKPDPCDNKDCNDNSLCTLDSCDSSTGIAVCSNTQICVDSDICTDDICDSLTGQCSYEPKCTDKFGEKCDSNNGECIADCNAFDIDMFLSPCSAKFATTNGAIDAVQTEVNNVKSTVNNNGISISTIQQQIATIESTNIDQQNKIDSIQQLLTDINTLLTQQSQQKLNIVMNDGNKSFYNKYTDQILFVAFIVNIILVITLILMCCISSKNKPIRYQKVQNYSSHDEENRM